uniref:ATP-dependent RNA helicase n=1 Tax=Hirondellea gigas TaxID=1518452 RepID=A0A2P2I6Y0_9CRUS
MPRTLQDKLLKRKLKKNQEVKKTLTTIDAPVPLSSSCNGTIEATFESIKHLLSEPVYKAVKAMGYTNLTEIQSQVFNALLTSDDRPSIKAIAKTGSGKTMAYLLPVIEMINATGADDSTGTMAIVVCPTRELAMQTYGVVVELLKFCRQKAALVRGGGVKKDEAKVLHWGASIVIGTPGRLLDHLQNTERFVYNCFSTLIIDEADRLFETGFEKEMTKIINLLRGIRAHQTLMFSATDNPLVQQFSKKAFHFPPILIDLSLSQEQATVAQLQQEFMLVPSEKRFFVLFCLLANLRSKKVMVFVSSRHSIFLYMTLLNNLCVDVMYMHGHQTQEQRNVSFNQFNRQDNGVLMCTDIGARGWDIPIVDLIIQYDPPDDPREYIHRVGRTARGGRDGKALVLLRPEEWEFVNFMRAHKVQLKEKKIMWEQAEKIHGQEYSKIVELVRRNGHVKSLAKTAFRSYIRSYLSHRLKYIYDKNTIDLHKAAKSFLLDEPPFTDIDEASTNPRLKKRPAEARAEFGKQSFKKSYKK